MRTELAQPFSMPLAMSWVFVTKTSSPTIWILSPSLSVIVFQPSQSFSAMPSSMERIGYFLTQSA